MNDLSRDDLARKTVEVINKIRKAESENPGWLRAKLEAAGLVEPDTADKSRRGA